MLSFGNAAVMCTLPLLSNLSSPQAPDTPSCERGLQDAGRRTSGRSRLPHRLSTGTPQRSSCRGPRIRQSRWREFMPLRKSGVVPSREKRAALLRWRAKRREGTPVPEQTPGRSGCPFTDKFVFSGEATSTPEKDSLERWSRC
jgi:hypothetical protein